MRVMTYLVERKPKYKKKDLKNYEILGSFEAYRTVFKGKIMKMGMQTEYFIKETGIDHMKNCM